MTPPVIQTERISVLHNASPRAGRYVLYWMQASQRSRHNHALELAIHWGNRLRLPVVAVFGLTDDYPGANMRHYRFMLQGLRELGQSLRRRGIQLIVRQGSPPAVAYDYSHDAAVLIADAGYLRFQRAWREDLAQRISCPMFAVQTDIVVPVQEASDKAEIGARTLRPKILAKMEKFLHLPRPGAVRVDSLGMDSGGMDLSDIEAAAGRQTDADAALCSRFCGGESHAAERLREFLDKKLDQYGRRNDPSIDVQSDLSPYLHFGQISPVEIARCVMRRRSAAGGEYIEQLVIRRELAINFVYYTRRYDSLSPLPQWAAQSLRECRRDDRPAIYTLEEFRRARTHDPYWNAAQNEMLATGKMHGYMRMYWGKKIIEWTKSPAEAYRIAIHLNDKYELDGTDPCGYANVLWCFGMHDRPWGRRPIFGNIRYMNAAGLERKFDIGEYVRRNTSPVCNRL